LGLAVGLIAMLFFAVLAITRWSLEWVLLVASLAFLPLAPLCFRYSRALWMYLDRRIDPIDPEDQGRTGSTS
jgi:hypothetical protein